MKLVVFSFLFLVSTALLAESPSCSGPSETKVSWPVDDPIWEFCYLAPSQSSAADGSSLEIRDAYRNGILVFERAHIPMLFAQYETGLCYRDWKDFNVAFLKSDLTLPKPRPAITTCDASVSDTQPVFNCPFTDVVKGGSVGSAADCMTGVDIEMYGDRVVLTTNHSAAWYKYSSRFTFFADGRIQPRFGFSNSDGTNFNINHFHHAYWRINFDINGASNDTVLENSTLMVNEFSSFRDPTGDNGSETTWSIIDSVSGRGYRINPTPQDYLVDADASGTGNHPIDVMATRYRLLNGNLPEYSDTPGNNSLGNCSMNVGNLVNSESIDEADVVFWYRASVSDIGGNAGNSMRCKSAGPIFEPLGDWARVEIFINGFE